MVATTLETSATAAPRNDQAPEAQLLELACAKLIKMEKKYGWPDSIWKAAWRYAQLCFYHTDQEHNATFKAWRHLVEVTTRETGRKTALPLCRGIRKRIAKACYELTDILPPGMPVYHEKWFVPYYMTAQAHVEAELADQRYQQEVRIAA